MAIPSLGTIVKGAEDVASAAASSSSGNQPSGGAFNEYMASSIESVVGKMFPQLSKFMDFSSQNTKADENKASDSVAEGTPNSRNRSQNNGVGNEMVLDSLTDISEKLKIQSIVLVSSLEQQTITNQLLARLSLGGSGNNGNGGGNGGGNGINPVQAAEDLLQDGKAIGNFIKSWGSRILGGASVGVLAAGAAAGLNIGDASGNAGIKKIYDKGEPDPTPDEIKEMQIEANKPKINSNNSQIKDLTDSIAKIEQHLKISGASEEERARQLAVTVELQKKINELQKQNLELEKGSSNDAGPVGLVGTGETKTMWQKLKAMVPTAVATPMEGQMPVPLGTDHATHTAIGQGDSALGIIRRGGVGMTPGGNVSGGEHPAGTGGYRASGTHMSTETVDKGIKLRDHLMKEFGMTKEQATGFAGTLGYESGGFRSLQEGHPVGGGPGGYGWAQWTNSGGGHRRDEFFANSQENSLDPKSDEAQMSMIDKELKGKYKNALAAILKTKTVQEAGLATLEKYEGMPDTAAIRAQGGIPATAKHLQFGTDLDAAIAKRTGGGGDQNTAFTPPKDTSEVLDHLAKARSLGLINGEECVALAAGAVGVKLDGQHGAGSTVRDWRRGESVMGGNLKAGTPVSTFLNPDGTPSDRYAGGGIGTPGARRDHAGVILGYDKDGKGFTLADQYGAHGGRPGSGPGHTTHVREGGIGPDGKYNAELDPKSYAAVKTENGQYLGGANSPMFHHDYTGMPARPYSHAESAAQKLAQKNYDHLKDAPKDRDIGIQAHANDILRNRAAMKDDAASVSSQLVKKSHEDSISEASQKAQIVHHQLSSSGGAHTMTPVGKAESERMSKEHVGSANPPAQRLSELFTNPETGKKWG